MSGVPRRGIVHLVGAGPGDPDLLTLRARDLIVSAEVVAHDALVPEGILALVPPEAERLCVGRRRGTPRPEYRLHPDVLDRARAGKRVVRLKAGDPFVFGRGGEEAEELARAGIPFEVVPGVTAALAAAARSGIPLTHRDIAGGVTIRTGHPAGESPPGEETIVLYMVRRRLEENLRALVAAGRDPVTPAAYVAAAGRPEQRTVTGTLADLSGRVADMDPALPALVIVGETVRLRDDIGWWEERPLAGRTVVMGRGRPGPSRIAAELRTAGAVVVEAPAVAAAPLEETEPFDEALRNADRFEGILFGCAEGVDATLARLPAIGRDVRDLPRVPILALDRAAGERLRAAGLAPAAILPGGTAGGLARERDRIAGRRLLVVTHDRGRPSLVAALRDLGGRPEEVASYRLRRRFPAVPSGPLHAGVFPSTSVVDAVAGWAGADRLRALPAVVFGPEAERAARSVGFTRVIRTARYGTVEALAGIGEGGGASPPRARAAGTAGDG